MEGKPECPLLHLPGQRLDFFPGHVPWICEELSRETGLTLTALRHLQDAGGIATCIMEVHSAPESVNAGYVWAKAQTIDSALPGETPMLAPWERAGWFVEAAQWTQTQLRSAGYVQTSPVKQLKGAWSWSSLLTAGTDRGKVYFKADYAKPPFEAAVISKLAGEWPDNVPSLIASDTERGWMLMPDFGGESLEALGLAEYAGAVSKFAQIQRSTAADLGGWKKLGCPDRTPPALLQLYEALLADGAVLGAGKEGLTEEERVQMRRSSPQIERMLTRLSESALPNVLSNEDFRGGNVVVRGEGPLFYDWSGSVITHPLFGINYFLNRMERGDKDERFFWRNDLTDARRVIASAFLSEWMEYVAWNELVSEFWLCRRLFFLYEAARCYADLAFIDKEAPWGAGTLTFIPTALRSLLAALDYQPLATIERHYE